LDRGSRWIVNGVRFVDAADRVVVEQVIDVHSQTQTLVPEPEDLRQLEIEDRVSLAVQIAGVEQVDRGRRVGGRGAECHETSRLASVCTRAGRRRRRAGRACRFPLNHVLGNGRIRIQLDARTVLKDSAQEYLDFWNLIGSA